MRRLIWGSVRLLLDMNRSEFVNAQLSGAQIRRLMRLHKKTVRSLASERLLTIKRVREVRAKGVSEFLAF